MHDQAQMAMAKDKMVQFKIIIPISKCNGFYFTRCFQKFLMKTMLLGIKGMMKV
jgi:hypothetical protein